MDVDFLFDKQTKQASTEPKKSLVVNIYSFTRYLFKGIFGFRKVNVCYKINLDFALMGNTELNVPKSGIIIIGANIYKGICVMYCAKEFTTCFSRYYN